MAVKYALYLNHLTPAPDDYAGTVMDARTRNLDYLVRRVARPGSGLTEEEVNAVVTALEREIVEVLMEGDNINLSLFQTRISIQGVFDSEEETFDRSKHQLVVHLSPGEALSKAIQQVSVEKVQPKEKRPVLQSFTDLKSGTRNEQATPGRIGRLKGLNLKINTQDEEQGLYFIGSNQQETKVILYSHNQPSELTFEIPEGLAKDTYRLEVRNFKKGQQDVRVGTLDYPIAVV